MFFLECKLHLKRNIILVVKLSTNMHINNSKNYYEQKVQIEYGKIGFY